MSSLQAAGRPPARAQTQPAWSHVEQSEKEVHLKLASRGRLPAPVPPTAACSPDPGSFAAAEDPTMRPDARPMPVACHRLTEVPCKRSQAHLPLRRLVPCQRLVAPAAHLVHTPLDGQALPCG